MKHVVTFFLERSMLIIVLLAAIFMLGFLSVVTARKEGFPEVSLNRITVQTVYPGASARDVEQEITVLMEEVLLELDGVKEILSYSEENVSRVEIRGLEDLSERDFERLLTDVENSIAGLEDLPAAARQPTVADLTTADTPVLEVAFSGEYILLKPYLEELKRKVQKIPGIAGADLIGVPDQEVHVLVDARRAKEHSIDLRLIADALSRRNVAGSGGVLRTHNAEEKLVIGGDYSQESDILQTRILSNAEGFGLTLGQIARIERHPEDRKLLLRSNGKPGATLAVRKRAGSDLLLTVDRARELLAREKPPSGIESAILFDQSRLTRGRISLLIGNAAMGFVLVVLVLMYFLDRHSALWTAFGIPVTLAGMLIFLKWQDISINLISLAGFIILVGMIVDDAVVVAEQYNSNCQAGMDRKAAIVDAVHRMWPPILASSATTMIAFAPLFMIGGFPGAFIWTIPLMVIVGLSVSLLEAFVMLPVHLVHGRAELPPKKRLITVLENLYAKTLRVFLYYRYRTLVVFLIMLLFALAGFRFLVKKDPFPQDAAEAFTISITLPSGIPLNQAEQEIKKIENILSYLPGSELAGYSSRIGTQSEDSSTDRGIQNNLAIIFVYLTPYEDRERRATDIMTALQSQLAQIAIANQMTYALNLKRLGPPMGRAIEVRLLAEDDQLREGRAAEIQEFLRKTPGVVHVETDRRAGLKETTLTLNSELLARADLREQDILTTLRIALDGLIVTRLQNPREQTDVRLRLQENSRSAAEVIKTIPVANRLGNLIHLDRFAKTEDRSSTATIGHIHGIRSTVVYGNLDSEILSPPEAKHLLEMNFPSTPEVEIEYSGQPVETDLIFSSLTGAALVALMGIYLTIALIFNSWSRPLVIMLSLPFLMVGAAFPLVTHGIPGSMMVGVAIVGLMGVVVNASIVLVDTIAGGAGDINPEGIIRGAVSRLRPIFLTTSTTVLGVLPTGYGIGGYDPFLSHMALVLAYGLLGGTFIVLVIVPVFLMIQNDLWMVAKTWKMKKTGRGL